MNIGYNVFAANRGKGYASRAVELLVRHLDESTAFHTATLLIDPGNVASLSVAARSGFIASGDIDGSRYFTRPAHDERTGAGSGNTVLVANLIYSAIASLDGYIEDRTGAINWGVPDDEMHTFVNDLERPIGTYLYGRRMYETMVYWETAHRLPDPSPAVRDFTDIWQAADKVVFSKTLGTVSSARTLIKRDFDPEAIRSLKATAEHDLTVGGAELAGQALAAGLVDELQLFSVPVLLGGGKRSLPRDVRADLELLDSRRFDSGVVFQRYAVKRDPRP